MDNIDELKVPIARIEEKVISLDERVRKFDTNTTSKLEDHEARIRALETTSSHLAGKIAAVAGAAVFVAGFVSPLIIDVIRGLF